MDASGRNERIVSPPRIQDTSWRREEAVRGGGGGGAGMVHATDTHAALILLLSGAWHFHILG